MTEGHGDLSSIVRPVASALAAIDEIYDGTPSSAGQGAFLVLAGKPGSGKTTFLNTIKLFARA